MLTFGFFASSRRFAIFARSPYVDEEDGAADEREAEDDGRVDDDAPQELRRLRAVRALGLDDVAELVPGLVALDLELETRILDGLLDFGGVHRAEGSPDRGR